MNKLTALLWQALVCLQVSGYGQGTVGLSDVVARAQKNYPTVHASQAQVEVAAAPPEILHYQRMGGPTSAASRCSLGGRYLRCARLSAFAREVGIRMALGSNRAGIFRLFLRDGIVLVSSGLAQLDHGIGRELVKSFEIKSGFQEVCTTFHVETQPFGEPDSQLVEQSLLLGCWLGDASQSNLVTVCCGQNDISAVQL